MFGRNIGPKLNPWYRTLRVDKCYSSGMFTIGAFHKNPTRQSQVVASMDSHEEVSTSWDTRGYPRCST
jgi:hypothetical protein